MKATAKFGDSDGRASWTVISDCMNCGNPAIGRVANSRKEPSLSEKIATEWAKQINNGETHLKCTQCLLRK